MPPSVARSRIWCDTVSWVLRPKVMVPSARRVTVRPVAPNVVYCTAPPRMALHCRLCVSTVAVGHVFLTERGHSPLYGITQS